MRPFTRFVVGMFVVHWLLPLCGFGEEIPETAGIAEATDIEELRVRAEKGHAESQFDLGWSYQIGYGVPQDDAEAVKWYRLAAAQGLASAQSNLGMLIIEGRDLSADRTEALNWFHKAARQGHQMACYNLGLAYSYGDGVSQDPAVALEWFLKAARSRDGVSNSERETYYQSREYVPWPLSRGGGIVEQGLPLAQHHLGTIYEEGVGVEQDDTEASRWYRKAADQGYGPAQAKLANLYRTGQGVAQDLSMALRLYHRAADQGDTMAQNHLGGLYGLGIGVSKDPVQACRWFTLSAAAGSEAGVKNRDAMMQRMTPDQIAECRRLVQEWNEDHQDRGTDRIDSNQMR